MGTADEKRGIGTGSEAPSRGPLNRPRLPRVRIGRVLAAVCTVLIFLILIASPLLFERPVVKVGVIVPLTGSSSYLVDVRDGMLLAVEELNRWGGINGAEIELLIRDSESDPAKAVEAFEELERDEEPLFYVSAMSHLTLPIVPLAEENQVVLVGVVTSAQNLTEGRHWIVRYYSDAEDEVDATLHSLELLGVSELGILHGSDEFSTSVEEILTERFQASGGSVQSVLLSPLDDDYDEEVSTVSARAAVFVVTTVTYLAKVILCLRDCGYAGHILTASGGSSPYVRDLPEAEGVYVAAPAMYNENYLPAKWLSEEFEERYGRPLTHYASCGYDVLNLFSGLMRDRELTRENVHEALESGFIFSGTTGPLQVDPGSHDIGFDLLSARISEGRLWYI